MNKTMYIQCTYKNKYGKAEFLVVPNRSIVLALAKTKMISRLTRKPYTLTHMTRNSRTYELIETKMIIQYGKIVSQKKRKI